MLAFARFNTNAPTWLLALAVAVFACGRVGYDEIENIAGTSRPDASSGSGSTTSGAGGSGSTTSGAGGSADVAARDAVDTEVEPEAGLAPDAEDVTDAPPPCP